jgi:signal transduction histidine kinase/ActR/RegA family two-component response regulator/HAMP domain-containing protein
MNDMENGKVSDKNDMNKTPENGPIVKIGRRIYDFFTLTFRGKAVLFLVPAVIIMSLVYTIDAIDTQRNMLRHELIKNGETIASIAARSAELPILSENIEQLNRSALLLKEISDVSFVSFYDMKFKRLIREGSQLPDDTAAAGSPDEPITYAELKDVFVFTAPVFTMRANSELDLFHAKPADSNVKEHIGWVRIGMSKDVMVEAENEVIRRGALLATLFSVFGIILIYIFMTIATRQLQVLIRAAKEIRKGEYSEAPVISSKSEIGRLSSEFNRMSREIREREQRLVTSEMRIKSMFERVDHAIFRLDKEGKIILTNNKFNELCGPVDSFSQLFYGARGSQFLQDAAFGALRNSEERIKGSDEAEIIAIMSVYPEVDNSGEITGFDGYFVDITDKKKLEETLIQAQKMESVGLLAGGIAHDFNNILTGVLGYASLMKRYLKDDAKMHKYADLIEKSASRAAALTQQLLGFARKGKFKIELVNINEILRELMGFLRETFDRNIEIRFDEKPNLPPIKGDSTQIYQAMLNICINARDAMPDGGRLYIKTESCIVHEEKIMDFFRIPQGEYFGITITDTGTGMSAAVRRRIFDPFFTTKVVGKGTGLGLAMVYGIVKNHNGYLDVYSEPGLGTTMRFYLPLAKGFIEDKHEDNLLCKGNQKGTILLIDDEEIIRELGKDILEAFNYKAILAAHGDEGVKMFNEHKDNIQLVILDMVMPGKSGQQVFTELRAVRPDVRVLISSGYDKEEYFHDLFNAGAAGFLQKPFQHAELIIKIEEALNS